MLPKPPTRVLDLGCGTGSLSVLLAEAGHEVTGVDLSSQMVARAVRKVARHNVAVQVVVGDAGDPPVEGPFDVILTRHLVWALPDAPGALARWVSLLRPGGPLVLIEGMWTTGAGIRGQHLLALVAPLTARATLRPLDDPGLWGRAITDERYLVVAQRWLSDGTK